MSRPCRDESDEVRERLASAALTPDASIRVIDSDPPSTGVTVRLVDDIIVVGLDGRLDGKLDGRLHGAVGRSLLNALAEEPRAVVCDLSPDAGRFDADGSGFVTATARAVQAWPATPVSIVSGDHDVRASLRRHPLGRYLSVDSELGHALFQAGRVVTPPVARMRLAPRATASRRARDFATRTCLDWGLRHELAEVSLVVSELVTNAYLHAATDIDLSLARLDDRLRLAVRDGVRTLPTQREPDDELTTGRGLLLVEGCSRAWGVLPTAGEGKVVWAVLDV